MFGRHNTKISSIWHYPVKSLAGQRIDSAEFIETGVRWDRSFMIIDDVNTFITQREHPILNQISAKIVENGLLLSHSGQQIEVDHQCSDSSIIEVVIWKSKMKARVVSQQASNWLSDILDKRVTLVAPDGTDGRIKYLESHDADIPLAFTDGYPVHIVNQASIDDLGKRLGQKLDVRRFRPNLLIEGLEAYAEDHIDVISTSDFELQVVKPAARCIIPNINPESGKSDTNVLAELSSFRKKMNHIEFGIYAYVRKKGKAFINEDLSIAYK